MSEHQDQMQAADDVLKKTEIGQVLLEHKSKIVMATIATVILIIAYAVYANLRDKANEEQLSVMFKYSSESLTPYRAGKIDKDALMKSFDDLVSKAGKNKAILSVLVDTASELKTKGHSADALRVLKSGEGLVKSNPYGRYIVLSNLAVLLEEAGQFDDAIRSLENLQNAKFKGPEAKLYLDLGRLYRLKGDAVKAKQSFEYVVANFPNEEFARMAKLYLSDVK